MKITLNNGVTLAWDDLETINLDILTKTDPFNLEAEMVITPVYLNKVGQLMAEAEDEVSRAEYDLREIKDELFSDLIPQKTSRYTAKNGNKITKVASDSEINAEIYTKTKYITAKERLLKAKRNLSTVKELYWAVKAKASFIEIMATKQRIFADGYESDVLEASVNKLLTKINQIK